MESNPHRSTLGNRENEMQSLITEVVGVFAAIGAAIVFFPQLRMVVKTKQTRDLSLIMWIAFTINNLTWITYGVLSWNYVLLLTQVFIFPSGLIILWYKIKYK